MQDIFYKESYFIIENCNKEGSRDWLARKVWIEAIKRGLVPNDIYDVPVMEIQSKRHYKRNAVSKQPYCPRIYKFWAPEHRSGV